MRKTQKKTSSGHTTYKLNTGKNYTINFSMQAYRKKTLMIPSSVQVTNMEQSLFWIEGDSILENHGQFTNNSQDRGVNTGFQLTAEGDFGGNGGIIQNYGEFTNNQSMIGNKDTTIENFSTATFTNNGEIKSTYNFGAGSLTIKNNTGANFHNFSNICVTNYTLLGVDYGGSTSTFTGDGVINNRGNIYTSGNSCSLNFSGGSSDKPQVVTTSGTSEEDRAQIYLDNSNALMTIGPNTILSFGDYGMFCDTSTSPAAVTLDGKLEFTSLNSYFHDVNISSGSGTIDMEAIRPYQAEYSDNLKTTQDLNQKIYNISIDSSCSTIVHLPFNCKFSNVNLGKANKVYYTVLKEGNAAKIVGDMIRLGDQVADNDVTRTYGDYAASDSGLGVSLPPLGGRAVTTRHSTLMSLSYVANNWYNQSPYKLLTNDLTDATDSIAQNIIRCYNFGFIGTKAISITGNGTAKFTGDNSGYNPSNTITLPNNVKFGASSSLFPFSYNYVKGTFSAGSELENMLLASAEVKFTTGFTLGTGYTLIVCGTLIG